FGAVVSLLVLRSCRLMLPREATWLWFALLGLFHLWPAVAIVLLFVDSGRYAEFWCAGFATAIAIPLALAGPWVARLEGIAGPHGAGWRFPLFPLSLFFTVGVAAALRTPLLMLSYGGGSKNESFFDGWLLIPLAAIAILWLIELTDANPRSDAVIATFFTPL